MEPVRANRLRATLPPRHAGIQRMVETPRLRHLHLPPQSHARLGVAVHLEEPMIVFALIVLIVLPFEIFEISFLRVGL